MIAALLAAHLRGVAATSILDVGPGYGPFARVAAQATGARRVTFLDCDEGVLAWQAEACRAAGLEAACRRLVLGADALAGLAERHDLILCQEVLEHLPDAEGVLGALAARLCPGGRMVITVPTRRSERWLARLDPAYARHGAFGHVRQFDEPGLRALLAGAGLEPVVLLPTQPHYFVFHTWVVGSRMRVEWSTGRILTGGVRRWIGKRLHGWSRRLFLATGPERWGRLLPRNYFVVARRGASG